MSEERRRILDMLAAGKITAAEAEQLLAALGDKPAAGTSEGPRAKPKHLIVTVNASEGGGANRVNIRVPLQILRAGVKLASLIPPAAKTKVDEAMQEHGLGFNLDSLKPEDIEELIASMGEMTIDVDQDKEKVRIYCE